MVKTIPAAMMHGITATHFATASCQQVFAKIVKDLIYRLQQGRLHVQEGRTAA
jgi:hypothetical protein